MAMENYGSVFHIMWTNHGQTLSGCPNHNICKAVCYVVHLHLQSNVLCSAFGASAKQCAMWCMLTGSCAIGMFRTEICMVESLGTLAITFPFETG